MTPSPLPRALAGSSSFVAAISGTYLVVYLYRWEWNRAVISGVFFLAAEIAYVGGHCAGRSAVSGIGPTPSKHGLTAPGPRHLLAKRRNRIDLSNGFAKDPPRPTCSCPCCSVPG